MRGANKTALFSKSTRDQPEAGYKDAMFLCVVLCVSSPTHDDEEEEHEDEDDDDTRLPLVLTVAGATVCKAGRV